MWRYLFFIDIEGHSDDQTVKDCLRKLQRKTAFLKVLGSYPGESEKA